MIKLGAKQGLILGAFLALGACAGGANIASVPMAERDAIEQRLTRDISILASDEFAGREPGTLGEERTVAFITDEMQKAGLVSGTNDPGSAWRAPVQLVRTKPFTSRIEIKRGNKKSELAADTAAAFTTNRRELVTEAPLVFVGKEAEDVAADDITGNIVVMLGEPGVSPRRRAVLFESNPAAIITVVEDAAAISRVNRAYGRERTMLESEADGGLTSFATQTAMSDVFGEKAWKKLVKAADDDEFVPVQLESTATIEATSERVEFTSYNVIGKLAGTVPNSGSVLLLGHWDHLGEDCGPEDAEDRICNGAVDNASGIAAMLELTRRLKAIGPHDRDIYVLATTAEESGLLGAIAFAKNPPVPLDTLVGAFNFDTVAIAPSGSVVGFIGEGETPLDPLILGVMKQAGRKLGDSDYATQFVRRQDGWALLGEGVPAVMLSTAFGSEITLSPYLSGNYHRAGDELETIELGGAIDDLLLHEEIVRRVANTATYFPPGDQ
ncbi:M28 family metallopeptidase [Erythrobacter crassostreae]|uniref:M20/M25/M40 family metallo-hydrolase n=1 Tax=Erythrobacter crassostreae TaxID=2828328 RepID=A0A9X1F4P6_9SPHN|nr:M20/M25/M40 family metallo-hydrolase [Erythrobacter crassostrea]MBV7260069.1 M20/M25/M40 family metallo-hydrolase [Erythrobacter crassostrea]